MIEKKTNAEMVAEWHRAFGLPVYEHPLIPDGGRVKLRIELIQEEVQEFIDAVMNLDIVEIADALGDLLYVTYGAALEFGIPIDEVFEEIQDSNMSKLGDDGKPIYAENGKVLKGPNFRLPDIKGLLFPGYEEGPSVEELLDITPGDMGSMQHIDEGPTN